MNAKQTIETRTVKDVEPAKDRVTLERLEEVLAEAERDPIIDLDRKEDYMNNSDYGSRWTMQKAICLILDQFPEPITVADAHELAFVIDNWFDKPNYGFGRAVIDVRKYKKQLFKCQHVTATRNGTDQVA